MAAAYSPAAQPDKPALRGARPAQPQSGRAVRFVGQDDLAANRRSAWVDEPPEEMPMLMPTDAERRELGELVDEAAVLDGRSSSRAASESLATATTDSTLRDIARIDEAITSLREDARLHPVFLTFRDPAMEQRYVQFFNTHMAFAAGKIYTFVASAISVGLLFPYLGFSTDPDEWVQLSVVVTYVGVSIGFLMCALMFLRQTIPIRELIFFIGLATHWPAFATTTLIAKHDQAYRYAYTGSCFLLCTFVAQPRFVWMIFFLTVTPIATCFIATFTTKHYWEQRTYFEMLYWLFPLFPLFMLRIFERRARDAFVENERGNATIAALDRRERMTRRIVARFFPVTVAQHVLKTSGSEACAVYRSTALVLTSVDGFSEWAAQTSAEVVVSKLATMFLALERLGRRYGVERVTITGDRFFGAVFPLTATRFSGVFEEELSLSTHTRSTGTSRAGTSSTAGRSVTSEVLRSGDADEAARIAQAAARKEVEAATARRCHAALRFATAARYNADVMAACVAVHVGDVVAGVVGTLPPKVDVFGAAVRHLEHLAERGKRRRVHASQAAVTAAETLGQPSADFEPSEGDALFFSRWRSRYGMPPEDGQRAAKETEAVSPTTTAPTEPTYMVDVDVEMEQLNANGERTANNDNNAGAGDSDEKTTPAEADDYVAGLPRLREPHPGMAPEHVAAADAVLDNVLLLAKHVSRVCDAQKKAVTEGFEARDAMLLGLLRRAEQHRAHLQQQQQQALGSASAPVSHSPGLQPSAEELELLAELEEFELSSQQTADVSDGHGSDVGGAAFESAALVTVEPLGDDEVLEIANPGDEKTLYTMDLRRLRFSDEKVEQQFRNRIRNSDFTKNLFSAFAMLMLFLLVGHVGNGCAANPRGRAAEAIIATTVMLHLAYLHHGPTEHRWNAVVNMGAYGVVCWAAALLYDPRGCDERGSAIAAGGNIIGLYFMCWGVTPAFSLDVWMPVRIALLCSISGQFCLAVLLRRVIIQDEVLVWDALPFCIVAALAFASLFTELAMRQAFQSTMRRRALQSNRTAKTQRTAEALELMLPEFAVERFTRLARRSGLATAAGALTEAASDSSRGSHASGATRLSAVSMLSKRSGSSGSEDGNGVGNRDLARAMSLRQADAVWPYGRVVLVVVRFEPPAVAFDAIADTMARIEAVARSRSLQKVQSAGTLVQLIGGLDRGQRFEDAVVNAVEAALEIERRVFPARLTEGWRHSAAVHCGPVFGAVIGTQGLSVGVYGDTVNTARAVLDAAPSEAVLCTLAVCQAVPREEAQRDFDVVALTAPVAVRGKGEMAVYRALERGRVDAAHGAQLAGQGLIPKPTTHSPLPAPSNDSEPTRKSARAGMSTHQRVAVTMTPGGMAPEEYAESIRSSLRTASLLPSAAAPVVTVPALAGDSKEGSDDDAAPCAFAYDQDAITDSTTASAPSATRLTLGVGLADEANEADAELADCGKQTLSAPAHATAQSGLSTSAVATLGHSTTFDASNSGPAPQPATQKFARRGIDTPSERSSGDAADAFGHTMPAATAFAFDDDVDGFSD